MCNSNSGQLLYQDSRQLFFLWTSVHLTRFVRTRVAYKSMMFQFCSCSRSMSWSALGINFRRVSTGGVHAAMVGSLHRTPVAILPFLTPHSAAVPFCEGILRYGTAWEVLRREHELLNGSMTREQVYERMRTVLSLTDVTQFPVPLNPQSVIFVAATVMLLSITL